MASYQHHLCALIVTTALGAFACGDEAFKLGGQARLEAAPAQLEFPVSATALDTMSTRAVQILNTGTGPVTIDRVYLRDTESLATGLPAALSIVEAPAAPFEVPGGGEFVIEVGYTRLDDEPRQVTLVVHPGSTLYDDLLVPVVAASGQPWLVASPAAVRFAEVQTGDSPEASVMLLNSGGGVLTVDRIGLRGDDGFEVLVGDQRIGEGTTPLDVPLRIDGHAQDSLIVRFSPLDSRAYHGTLTLYGDSSNSTEGYEVPLSGNDAGPCILVNPPRVAFGQKPAGSLTELPVEITSCGAEDLVIDSISLSDASSATRPELAALGVQPSNPAFGLTLDGAMAEGASAWVVPPGETRSFGLTYLAPYGEAEGAAQQGTVVLDTNAFSRFHLVDVAGSAIEEAIPGCHWGGGEVRTHDVVITLTADDKWSGWIDGDLIAEDMGPWNHTQTYELQIQSGCHVLGVHAWDTSAVISGLIATISIDGVVTYVTGDNKPEWNVTGDAPGPDWHEVEYDDAAWQSPRACSNPGPWGGRPAVLLDAGAEWVWWNDDCRDLTAAWFRLVFTVQ